MMTFFCRDEHQWSKTEKLISAERDLWEYQSNQSLLCLKLKWRFRMFVEHFNWHMQTKAIFMDFLVLNITEYIKIHINSQPRPS